MTITREEVLEQLDYDPTTGIFVWLTGPRAGQRAGRVKRAAGERRNAKGDGYRQIVLKGRYYYAHRLAWLVAHGSWPKDQVDHRNHQRDDNRIANLRPGDHSDNSCNATLQRNNTSGVRGVSWYGSTQKWCAVIQRHGKKYHLGYFDDIEQAAAAYAEAAIRLHGEFCNVARRPVEVRLTLPLAA